MERFFTKRTVLKNWTLGEILKFLDESGVKTENKIWYIDLSSDDPTAEIYLNVEDGVIELTNFPNI